MAERKISSRPCDASTTGTITVEEEEKSHERTLQLTLQKPQSDRKVKWTTETVDNEHMNKKKSKCCCIYEKPKLFGESSDEEEDDETHSCHGHKKKCFRHGGQDHFHDHDVDEAGPSSGGDSVDRPGPST